MKLDLKEWKAEATATPEEIDVMVKAVFQEVAGGDDGDFSMNVDAATGTLVVAVREDDGVHVFECSIRRSNKDAEEMIVEGELAFHKKQEYLA